MQIPWALPHTSQIKVAGGGTRDSAPVRGNPGVYGAGRLWTTPQGIRLVTASRPSVTALCEMCQFGCGRSQ